MPWYFYVSKFFVKLFFIVFTRWKVKGEENIPSQGPVLIVANHLTNADPPLLCVSLNREVRFMAKEELFKIPVLGWIIPRMRAFPVRRGTADRRALRRAMDLLKRGEVVTIFLEGTRSEDGTLQDPELGFALIALKTRAPVVPMALIGTDTVLPRHCWHFKVGKVRVRIGKPMTFPDLYDGKTKKPDLETVGRRVMAEIARLQEGA